MKLELLPGDEFVTRNPMALGSVINIVQTIKAVDNQSAYTHAGIITASDGTTLEALWTVKEQKLFRDYGGQQILIVRNVHMSKDIFAAGYEKIKGHIGQWYPFHRLLLHMVGLAKFVHWSRLVCSELAAKFEAGCAEFLGDNNYGFLRAWYGVNPDNLADRWRDSKHYQVLYEGDLGDERAGVGPQEAGNV